MPQVSAFHSVKPNTPRVYHNNSECNTGNNIEPENKRSGTDGRQLCEQCGKLNKEGK